MIQPETLSPGDCVTTVSNPVRHSARVRLHDTLSRLDMDWLQERRRYMLRGRGGALVVPSPRRALTSAVLTACAALFIWGMLASALFSPDASVVYGLMSLMLLGFGGYTSIADFLQYRRYKQAEAAYYARRSFLLNCLERR